MLRDYWQENAKLNICLCHHSLQNHLHIIKTILIGQKYFNFPKILQSIAIANNLDLASDFMNVKITLIIIGGILGLMAISEFGLRLTMGLGNPALYISDDHIGYLLAPNQKLRRFGNSIKINQYSMRSGAIQPEKRENTQRLLFVGDSIVYGTGNIDQTQTIPSLVAKRLQQTQPDRSIEALNAAANSWSTRNQLAYLQRFGLFDADVLVLVINTDDLFAAKPSSLVVGKATNYPDKAPLLALIELYQRSAPPKSIPELEELRRSEEDKVAKNLAAIKEIKQMAEASDTRFVLAITPLLRELQSGYTDEEKAAKEQLQQLVTTEKIEYLDFLNIWSDFPQPEFLYRDRIHPNIQGNTKLSEEIANYLATAS